MRGNYRIYTREPCIWEGERHGPRECTGCSRHSRPGLWGHAWHRQGCWRTGFCFSPDIKAFQFPISFFFLSFFLLKNIYLILAAWFPTGNAWVLLFIINMNIHKISRRGANLSLVVTPRKNINPPPRGFIFGRQTKTPRGALYFEGGSLILMDRKGKFFKMGGGLYIWAPNEGLYIWGRGCLNNWVFHWADLSHKFIHVAGLQPPSSLWASPTAAYIPKF